MNVQINQIVTDFNDTLLTLLFNIADACPTSVIGTNIKDIKKIIENAKKNPRLFTKFIDLFCLKVLQYKSQIDRGDEDFFMNKTFEEDLKDQNQSFMNHVISLKSVWSEFKNENKTIVISYMQILCALTQQYYDLIT
jgi:hypothetical protein